MPKAPFCMLSGNICSYMMIYVCIYDWCMIFFWRYSRLCQNKSSKRTDGKVHAMA